MTRITYEVVEHDGGWSYKVGDVFTETWPTHAQATAAAHRAATEHGLSGETVPISFETPDGVWHEETAQGDDRPEVKVKD